MEAGFPWRGWANAEIYDGFVRAQGIYRWLNRRLVDLARIETAHRVLDLACGAGATTGACLAALPAGGEIWGVDASEAMVGVARSRTADPRARFVVAPAAAVAEAVPGHFDRAVSNAAFWQFPATAPVLAALGRLLATGALFAFNVPAERVAGEPAPVHPFQVALARAIEAATGMPFPRPLASLDADRLATQLAEAGFELTERRRLTYETRQGELMELMEIPAMIEPLTATLSAEARRRVLARARRRTDATEPVAVPWIFFVACRR